MSDQSQFYNPRPDRMALSGSGFQWPRLTTSQRTSLPVGLGDAGLTVFDQTLAEPWYWDGTAWVAFGSGGGGGGTYETIYSGATTTPQVSLWTIVDGRATQVGLDAQVTTGSTSITTGQGITFDGHWDLSPIGTTLAIFSSTNCTYAGFAPGTLANLSTLYFNGCTFTTFDISGIQNQCGLSLVGCTIPTLTLTPSSVYNVVVHFGTYGDLDFTGCPDLNSITMSSDTPPTFSTLTCGDVTVTGSATLTSISIGGTQGVYGDVNVTNCTALTSVLLDSSGTYPNVPEFDSLNFSGCTSLTSIATSSGEVKTPSLDITGCTALTTISLPSDTLVTVTLSTLPAAITVGLQGCALDVASVNAILVALDANGLSGGVVYLDLGTSAAPTGAGIVAKASLLTKGWTAVTN